MTRTDPKLVAEIDAIEDKIVDEVADTEQTTTDLVDVGGLEPTGGPYKPTTDEPAAVTQTK